MKYPINGWDGNFCYLLDHMAKNIYIYIHIEDKKLERVLLEEPKLRSVTENRVQMRTNPMSRNRISEHLTQWLNQQTESDPCIIVKEESNGALNTPNFLFALLTSPSTVLTIDVL